MPAYRVSLVGKEGAIWKSRPEVKKSGLVSVVENASVRKNGTRRPLFAAAKFNTRGDILAAVGVQDSFRGLAFELPLAS